MVVDITTYRSYKKWKIQQKAPEAIDKDQAFQVRIYIGNHDNTIAYLVTIARLFSPSLSSIIIPMTEDVERFKQMMKKHWSFKLGKLYKLKPQELAPTPKFDKREVLLPSASMKLSAWIRRIFLGTIVVYLTHLVLICLRRLLDIYVRN